MENNLEKKLKFYSLYDNEIKLYDGIVMAFDDKTTISFYLEQFKNIILSFTELPTDKYEEAKSKFLEKIHNCCIICVGSFDNVSGSFTNESSYIADLSHLSNDEIIKTILNESEEKN